MSFTSWTSAPFVAVVFVLYYAYTRTAWQVGVLVVASLVFYAADNLTLLPLLLFAIVVTFYSLRFERYDCARCVDLQQALPAAGLGWTDGQHVDERTSLLVIDAVERLIRPMLN